MSSNGASGKKKPAPLQTGGTLAGKKALGKDANLNKASFLAPTADFADSRWTGTTWDLAQFAGADGETDWDAVIDAEVVRRKWLEDRPEGSFVGEGEITFTLNQIPAWVWIKRFHLPQAELINGRACMVGYFAALGVEAVTGQGLLEQQSSFFGQVLLAATVVGCLLFRSNADLDNLKTVADEATFYDSQWNATWNEGAPLPEDAAPGPSQADDLANPPKYQLK